MKPDRFNFGRRVCSATPASAIAAIASLGLVGGANAELYEHTFTGRVISVTGSVPDPWQDVHVGSEVALSYIFDTEMEDLDDDPDYGIYNLIQFSFTVEGVKQTAPGSRAYVCATPVDEFWFQNTESLPIGGDCGMYFQVPGFYQTDEFPLYHDMDEPWGTYWFEVLDLGWHFAGDMTGFSSQPVPAPGVVWSVALLIGVQSRRRRRRRVK